MTIRTNLNRLIGLRLWFMASIAAVALFSVHSFGQDSTSDATKKWKYSILTNLTLTLNHYSGNWAGDEVSAFSWGWQFDGSAQRALAPWFTSINNLKLKFGQTSIKEENSSGNKEWEFMKKSSDLIDFESVARFTMKGFIDPFVGARAVTQFADMRTERRVYLNPAVVTESFGAIKDILKNKFISWNARIGGAVRQSIERNYQLPDSLRPSDKVTNDGGVEFVTNFKAVSKDNRLSYIAQIKIYEAIFSSIAEGKKETSNEKHWRYPDVTWENTLGVTLTKYIMLNFYAQLLYDKEIDSDIRFRETIGLALTYTLAN